ncbi:MAG: aspartate dehydrogenase [Pigmentiphaga sp.]|uniref:aspartate dehydrogenase n=1 Tax=Pigmentiphaga sp. TaxID=1977564 RepID=UPI00299FD38B|nr:aspartate dehydrogenase [Pigmentiphaga sp.]MDX3906416.1 aspartate dehydrogenase [Pigmentiphaga sp.]
MKTVLLIGFGAMGRSIFDQLRHDPRVARWLVLDRPERLDEITATLGGCGLAVAGIEDLNARPDFAVECAGHGAVTNVVPVLLRRGIDTIVASVGALAHHDVAQRLDQACSEGGAQLTLVPGALAGIDALAAARACGLDEVRYTGRKPPRSWKGTLAAERCDLDALARATVFFEGTAREAATLFPQNANVAAMAGLSGLGLDRTRVQLIADPEAGGNTHTITARGAFGRLEVEVEAAPFAANPKTSALAGMSIARAIRNRLDTFIL